MTPGTPATQATILIVDDHAANLETLVALLEPEGYRLLEAADGLQALQLAAEYSPDLVLLDVMMPELDGFEVCRRLRADPRTAEMPVILITALDDHAARVTGTEAGADDFVSKPFNRAELRARVRTITRLNRYARLHLGRVELEEATQRIREQAALIDLNPDAILVVDLDYTVRLWNRGAEQLYGWPGAEAVGRHVGDVLRSTVEGHLVPASRTVRGVGRWRGEVSHLTRGDTPVILDSLWTMLSGEHPRILIVNRDITEKKQTEEALLRTQRLENLGALASGIVHDLNNVLAPILMASDLLRSDAGDPEAPAWIEIIDSSAKRGSAMVRQILSFARGSSGGKQAVQLRSVVNDLHRMLKNTFPPDIDCKSVVAEDVWRAIADSTQVYQMLLNFAVNARDAMPRGGRLTIDMRNVVVDHAYAQMNADAQPGPYVAVSVSDTGEGIAAAHLERIFDPFFTTKAPDKGTGLGLDTVRQLISAHGGFLELESTVGKGTRFTIYLPAVSETPLAPAPPAVLPQGDNQLVLIADDEASVRAIMKATLENYGYRVVLAGDGTEAVARVAAHGQEIDLLVADLRMPHMDGLAAIREIRRLMPNLPVIAVSGSPGDKAKVEQSGLAVQGVLAKPLSAAILLTEIDRVLRAQ